VYVIAYVVGACAVLAAGLGDGAIRVVGLVLFLPAGLTLLWAQFRIRKLGGRVSPFAWPFWRGWNDMDDRGRQG
jgi:hypothetical protein